MMVALLGNTDTCHSRPDSLHAKSTRFHYLRQEWFMATKVTLHTANLSSCRQAVASTRVQHQRSPTQRDLMCPESSSDVRESSSAF